jgi:hypothetical protein
MCKVCKWKEACKCKGIRDKHKIQPFYKKALIFSNIFLIKYISVKGIRDKREIQPFYKKALISLNIFLIKCNNNHSLIMSPFVNKYKSDQESLQKRVINLLESLFIIKPLLIYKAIINQC